MSSKPTTATLELGEDGEDFIVTGVTSNYPGAAISAVRQYCVDSWGETLEHNSGEDYVALEAAEYRTDWAWQPTNEDYPMDEALLVSGDKAKNLSQFAGWRVKVA